MSIHLVVLLDTEVGGEEEGHVEAADHEGRYMVGAVDGEDPVAKDIQQEDGHLCLEKILYSTHFLLLT